MMNKQINMRLAVCSNRSIEARTAWCWTNAAVHSALNIRKLFENSCGFSSNLHESSILPMGRQEMLESAVADGITHLVCFDSDMIFKPYIPMKLVAAVEILGAGIVGCAYPQRRGRPVSTARDVNGNRLFIKKKMQDAVEAQTIGFGMVCIDVAKAAELPKPWFEFTYKSEVEWEGEDVRFCRLMREAGHKIFVDAKASRDVQHVATRELGVGEMVRGEP